MKTHTQRTPARGLAALLLVTAIGLFLSGCSRPPDDVVKKGVQMNANMQAVRITPFAQSAAVLSHNVTKKYDKGDGMIYEFEATVKVTAGGLGGSSERTVQISGKQYFEKSGGEWRTDVIF